MDKREPLIRGYQLILGDTIYLIAEFIGCGSNAFVYTAYYTDNINKDKNHMVLIKELFPYQAQEMIYRDHDGTIRVDERAEDYFFIHKNSFIRGNACHLDVQAIRADMVNTNINSYEKNNTIYTVLGDSNGETMLAVKEKGMIKTLEDVVYYMLGILDSLEIFHKNGLLHLDISPDNVLLIPSAGEKPERRKKTMLIDYNSVWNLDEIIKNNDTYFSIKDNYSAPEVRLREKTFVSAASDLFSVCAVFLEYLQGKPLNFSDLYLYSSGLNISQDSELIKNMPPTVAEKAVAIIRKGLRLSPERRYQNIEALRAEFIELQNRINGIGITHAALWDASKANFNSLVKKNERYKYLFDPDSLIQCNVRDNNASLDDIINKYTEGTLRHVQITGSGGIGKTTALLNIWKNMLNIYSPSNSVPMYIPLYNYKSGYIPYIKSCLLERLKFDSKTTTIEDALRSLDNLLSKTCAKNKPAVVLLLDGLNEITGDNRQLFLEISELMEKPGVQIVITSRSENNNLNLNRIEILPLTEIEIKSYLAQKNAIYPIVSDMGSTNKNIQSLLSNPMLLSIYVSAWQNEQRNIDITTVNDLLDNYINGLLTAHKTQSMGNEPEQVRAEYAMEFLLPAIANHMKKQHKHFLNPNEIYNIIKKYYNMLSKKIFLKSFPEYIGKSKYIKGKAKTAEEWFNTVIDLLICRKFALMYKDYNENYCLSHENFYDYFIYKYGFKNTKLRKVKMKLSAPYIAVSAITICGMIWGTTKISNIIIENSYNSYPNTEYDITIVRNILEYVNISIDKLGKQIKNDIEVLENYVKHKQFIEEKRIENTAYILKDKYTDETIQKLISKDTPIPVTVLKDLLNAPNNYFTWTDNVFNAVHSVLENEIYPEEIKIEVVALFENYIKRYVNIYYAQLQLIISQLNDDAKEYILEAIPYIDIFGEKFMSERFITNKTELETIIESENLQIIKISDKLKTYGVEFKNLKDIN